MAGVLYPHSKNPMALAGVVLGYLSLHFLLDQVSAFNALGQTPITPWNPSPGLSLILLLLFGRTFAPLLFFAPLLTLLFVRDASPSLLINLTTALVYMTGYWLAASVLLHPRLRFDLSLRRYQSVILILLVGAIASAIVSMTYSLIYGLTELIQWETFWLAVFRSWIGDLTGIIVITPLTLFLTHRYQELRWSSEQMLYLLSVVLLIWTLFGTASSNRPEFFFLLFLPLSFIGVRFGLGSTCIANAITEATILLFVTQLEIPGDEVTLMQSRLVVYFLASLTIGTFASEQRRIETSIRMYQDALARIARRSSMGEVSATIAHEVNQPLTAIGNYAQLIKSMTASDKIETASINSTTEKIIQQVERAAEVIQRIRNLTQLRHADRRAVSLTIAVSQDIEFMRDELTQAGVHISVRASETLPKAMIDRVQIGQLFINLIRNSIEAFKTNRRTGGRIEITLLDKGDGWIEAEVKDNGPGFSPAISVNDMPLVISTKDEGMGIGLALCRSIIEVHGGRFSIGGDTNGASVKFTLPTS